ncbi:MAG: hypothetical protein PHS52_00265 [Desulfotomaculaceae bacterium]|nr:hypothetical protein [Desulfotomaculaceae bacterium]
MKLAIKIDDSGLTLLEVLISFVVLTTTLFAVMNSFALAARRNIDTGRHQTALALAQSKLEELKNETYNNVVEITTPVQFSSESDYFCFCGFTYTISIDDSSFDELNKTVTVVVFYKEGDTTKQVALTTGFTKR